MNIAPEKAVTLTYTLTDKDGNVLDKADASQPFIYLHGNGGIIPGLENALEGKAPGDSIQVTLEPSEAYGDYSDQLLQDVPMEMFAGMDKKELVEGAQFHAETNQGTQVVSVKKVNENSITIDGNHPMAGKTLNFDVKVLDVRDATPEEIAHGHIHAHGDSCEH